MDRRIVRISVINDISYDQRMLKTAQSLYEHNYEVHIIGRLLPNSKSIENYAFTPHRLQCVFNKGKLFYIEFNIRLILFMLFKSKGIYVATDLDTLFAMRVLSFIKRAPLVYDAHEYFTEVPELSHRPISKGFWRLLERILLPGIKYCYTVSPGLVHLFKTKYKKHFGLVRNVPRLKSLPIQNNQSEKIIIYQGALNVGRGLEVAIRSMKHIDAKLYIVGEGDISDDLKQMVPLLRLESKVTFKGNVSPEILADLTRKASVGINLLENRGLNYYYSLANKFFDYIEAGIPQISMRFPDYDQLNKEYEIALLMDGLNEFVLSNAINDLLTDTELYSKLHENCLRARKELCWEKEEQILLDLYNNINS